MKILSRLTNSLYKRLAVNVQQTDGSETHQNEDAQNEGGNIIEIRDNIIKAIVNALKMFKCHDTSRLTLNIYILDDTIYNGLGLEWEGDVFKDSVCDSIRTELGIAFKTISLSNKKPNDLKKLKQAKSRGIDYLFYSIEETRSYAVITAMDGYGSLSEDSVELLPKPDKVYNIGRGKNVKTKTGMFRTNDIVIDDNEKCEEHEKNQHVSRCHAHIEYKKSVGFVLFVDDGGTKICGKRTRIQRQGDNEPIDLGSDTKNFFPLHDGDIIELGKEVYLKFKYA